MNEDVLQSTLLSHPVRVGLHRFRKAKLPRRTTGSTGLSTRARTPLLERHKPVQCLTQPAAHECANRAFFSEGTWPRKGFEGLRDREDFVCQALFFKVKVGGAVSVSCFPRT